MLDGVLAHRAREVQAVVAAHLAHHTADVAEQFVGEDAGRRVYRLVVNAKNRMGGYAGREGRVCQFDMATGRLVSAGRG